MEDKNIYEMISILRTAGKITEKQEADMEVAIAKLLHEAISYTLANLNIPQE